MRIQYLERRDWLDNYLDIEPGEHVNVVCPTGSGKSHLLYQVTQKILERYDGLRLASFCPKPRDETTQRWAAHLGLRETPVWPPRKKWWESEPPGHVLWPRHITGDEIRNRAHLGGQFKLAINDLYVNGPSITFADDAYLIGAMYGLNQELDRHWVAGRSMNASLFTTLQKPSGTAHGGGVSSFAYDAPTHLLFGRDNDKRNLDRISEIGLSQIDPDQIRDTVRNLKVHRIGNSAVSEMLYLDRRGPYLAIIGI